MFLECSCGAKALNCAFVVFGAEVALSAVFIYDVEETDGHCDAGYSCAKTPVVFYAVCLVVGKGHEVHVALVRIGQCSKKRFCALLLQLSSKRCTCSCNSISC